LPASMFGEPKWLGYPHTGGLAREPGDGEKDAVFPQLHNLFAEWAVIWDQLGFQNRAARFDSSTAR